jgi:hypothetical protein
MKLFIETTCPICATDLVLEEEAAPGREPLLGDTIEVECCECGWEFACDADGTITDDGGADREGPFTVDDEGELDGEALRQVRCPRCQQPHEVGEEGLTGCRHCRQVFVVTEPGPGVGGANRAAADDEEDYLPWDFYGSLAKEPLTCPCCGYDSGDDLGDGFPLCCDGRAECPECGQRFFPGIEGGLTPPEPEPDHLVLEVNRG